MKKPLKTCLLSVLAASTLLVNVGAVSGAGTVSAPSVNVRASKSMNSVVVTTVTRDTPLLVSKTDDINWYKVNCGGSDGYISARYLNFSEEMESQFGYGMVLSDTLFIYARPSDESVLVGGCEKGDIVKITGVSGQWLHVEFEDFSGYVDSDNIELGHEEDEYGLSDLMAFAIRDISLYAEPSADSEEVLSCGVGQRLEVLNSKAEGWHKVRIDGIVGYAECTDLITYPAAQNGVGAEIAAQALTYQGIYYIYGGTSPRGFDCSGLVYYLYHGKGFNNVTRRASTQFNDGDKISIEELQPGDPVFFSRYDSNSLEHVGIYIGEGKFIHSPSTGKTIRIDTLLSGYYAREYWGAVRIYGME